MGISKRELFEDYYMDEIGEIIGEWNALHDPDSATETAVDTDPMSFFGEGGEVIDA